MIICVRNDCTWFKLYPILGLGNNSPAILLVEINLVSPYVIEMNADMRELTLKLRPGESTLSMLLLSNQPMPAIDRLDQ